MAHAITWDSAFDADPQATGQIAVGAQNIRERAQGLRERMALEHIFVAGTDNTNHGRHRQGSALAYYQSGAPSNHPDGAVALGADTYSQGRLWVPSGAKRVRAFDGANWTGEVYTHSSDAVLDLSAAARSGTEFVIFTATPTATRTVTLPAVASFDGRILHFVFSGTAGAGEWSIDGNGSETINGYATWALKTSGEHVKLLATSAGWVVLETEGTVRSTTWSTSSTVSTPSYGTWYNPGSKSLTLEAGTWALAFSATYYAGVSGGGIEALVTGLSTSSSSMSSRTLVAGNYFSPLPTMVHTLSRPIARVVLTGSTTYYLIVYTSGTGTLGTLYLSVNASWPYGYDGFIQAIRIS